MAQVNAAGPRVPFAMLGTIEAAFKTAEVDLMRDMAPQFKLNDKGEAEFPVPEKCGGTVGAAYRGTQMGHLADHLIKMREAKKVGYSGMRAVVLGAGIGRSAATLSFFCSTVEAYETVPSFITAGEKIMRRFGIKNVNFIEMNYMYVPRKGFLRRELAYFNNPMPGNPAFEANMAFTLTKLDDGALIISNGYVWHGLMHSSFFKPYYPASPMQFTEAEFPTLKRTHKPGSAHTD